MHTTPPFKTLHEIRQTHGFPEASSLASWLRELVLTYNQSQQKYPLIAHTHANVFTQKVKHDSFSQSLNRTILNLESLICNDCFPSSNCEHSNLTTVSSDPSDPHPGKGPALIYRQYTRRRSALSRLNSKGGKKQIQQFRKGWQELIRDSLLLDLYRTYLRELDAPDHTVFSVRSPAPAHRFINDVLRHFSSSTLLPRMRLNPPIPTLPASGFLRIVKHYRTLAG